MCYGTPLDRDRVAALAKLKKQSTSEYLVALIREQHAAVFGPEVPNARPQQR